MNFDIQSYEASNNVPTSQPSALVEIEKSRAIQEVQAAMVIAKRFPRDNTAAFTRIMAMCSRPSFAERSFYSFPRGGQTVRGPSIRMMEAIASAYGNLDFGIREIERRNGRSIAESYCWDLETNVKSTKIFEIKHVRDTKKGPQQLTDERDIYEMIANFGARRLRACIEAIIPADIREAAKAQADKTIASGGQPIEDKIRNMVLAFKDLGVTQEMIEKRLGHEIALTTGEELLDLFGILNTLKDKQAKREEIFEFEAKDEKKPRRSLETLDIDVEEVV